METYTKPWLTLCLERSSSRNKIEDDADDSQHQKDVNPRADSVYTDYSEEPQYKQDYCNRPKHFRSPKVCAAYVLPSGLIYQISNITL
jgi:hypothetical protein